MKLERLFHDRNREQARQAGRGRPVPLPYLYERPGQSTSASEPPEARVPF